MKYLKLSLCFLVWSFWQDQARSQDINDRLAEYQLERGWADDGMSVLIDRIQLTVLEPRATTIDEEEGRTPTKKLISRRVLQRLTIGEKGRKKRIDTTEYELLDASEVFGDHKEAQLLHENVGWYNFRMSGFPKEGIIRLQLKGGVPAIQTRTQWKHPFVVATTVAASILDSGEDSIIRLEYKVIEEEPLADGRTRILAFLDTGAIHRIVFAKEPTWLVEEIEFYGRNTEWKKSNPAPPKTVTKQDLDKYELYAKTQTQWKGLGQNRVVPWQTNLYQKSVNGERTYEFRFRDWKFGDDVDLKLLEEESFTEAKIDASIDFFKIRQMFDSEGSK
ncbi:MAG: hypothetical protein ACK5PB_18880 [Pirellula sp.]|jgi:hypothetical protein